MEIRFVLSEVDSTFQPHVMATSLLTHLASNEEEYAVSVLSLSEKELQDHYHADWGLEVYFRPKRGFSDKLHCKMLALYAADQGMAYVFFLFDDPDEELERQQYILQFDDPAK